jgi:acetyl-CoA C-acetyltransferase
VRAATGASLSAEEIAPDTRHVARCPVLQFCRGAAMTGKLAAVLGTGQTRYAAARADVSMSGLVREAIDRALGDAGVTLHEIDAVVVGKAADIFEGVMMPELVMADAIGITGKPVIRAHTAGSVGGTTGVLATDLVRSGKHRRVLALAWEKQSESNAMWALTPPAPFGRPVSAGAGGYFAPHVRAYIHRSGAPPHTGAMVAVKDRRNGSANPLAHLQQPDITVDEVLASPMMWDPIRREETCPSSDGACAVIIGDEHAAELRISQGHPVAWIHATALRTEPLTYPGRDHVNPAAGRTAAAALWNDANISCPVEEIDVAEIYVAFSWFEPMWLENLGFAPRGQGWKLTVTGETGIGGRLPVNPSGGVLSSNPIGASGLIRFAEAAIQVMGKAGAHQVPGARKALGHAYGGGAQYFAMWVVAADKPGSTMQSH